MIVGAGSVPVAWLGDSWSNEWPPSTVTNPQIFGNDDLSLTSLGQVVQLQFCVVESFTRDAVVPGID
jgi:hypothetical protein